MKKKVLLILCIIAIIIFIASIVTKFKDSARVRNNMEPIHTTNKTEKEEPTMSEGENKLYYLGHASLRITTKEGKVIYVDPYMGSDYDTPADLILVTHAHYDHYAIDKVKNRNADFKLITWKEALVNGEHKSFDLGYAKIDAVEAGYNKNHSVTECVGYVITLSDDTKVYIAGDTSETPTMPELATLNIDYAFFPCDGVYNMNATDAAIASSKVKAKHNIPYHTTSDGRPFDEENANRFNAENKLIIKPLEEITLEHE